MNRTDKRFSGLSKDGESAGGGIRVITDRPVGPVEAGESPSGAILAGRVPTGQSEPGTRLAMARSVWASASGASPRSLRNAISSVRSSRAETARTRRRTSGRNPSPLLPMLQSDTTSAAVTAVPSENRALSRNVTIHVLRLASNRQEAASPGPTRPLQSTQTRVSYNCRKSNRSLSFDGCGALAGSIRSPSPTVATGSPGSEINPQSTELSAGNLAVGDGGGGWESGGGTFTGSGGRDAV